MIERSAEETKMKIVQLAARGFRSLRDITWAPGDLNVVIGPNGAGKSNLLRLLEMISAAAQGKLGKYVQKAGGMEPLLWDGQGDGLYLRLQTSPMTTFRAVEADYLTYEMELARLGTSSAYRVDRELFGNLFHIGNSVRSSPVKMLLDRKGLHARIFDDNNVALQAPEESISEEETLLSLLAGPFAHNSVIPSYQRELAGWSIYHDLNVGADASIRQPVVSKTEKRVAPDAQNLINVLHTLYTGDRDFKKAINSAMRAAFGGDFDELTFPPASDQRIQLRVRWKSLRMERSAADISDGTLRFLFLLTVLASPDAAPLIAIDEPETGLHPSMLPIIAEFAEEASSKSQVIFTTHSPSLLDAFKNVIPTTTIAIWENGQTALTVKSGDDVKQWLEAYSLGHLLESGDLEAMA